MIDSRRGNPPFSLIVFDEKLRWPPEPAKCLNNLGSKDTETLRSSATLPRRYLATQR
jgi:hypothetical protein